MSNEKTMFYMQFLFIGAMLAARFLQIPLHSSHPCSILTLGTVTRVRNLHPIAYTMRIHAKKPDIINVRFFKLL